MGYVHDPAKDEAIALFAHGFKIVRTGLRREPLPAAGVPAGGGTIEPDDVYEGKTIRHLIESLRADIDDFLA